MMHEEAAWAEQMVRAFLQGTMDIADFRKIYDEDERINDFLQKIIDELRESKAPIKGYLYDSPPIRNEQAGKGDIEYLLDPASDPGLQYGDHEYDSVRNFLTYEFRMLTHDVETATGALNFYNGVYIIYYQRNQSIPYRYEYSEAFVFSLHVIPDYLSGGESEKYIEKHILPLFPETMKKTERIKAIKAKIREVFRSEKGYPQWAQQSDWPLGKDGRPATYLGKGKSEGDLCIFRFRDESTGEIITVEQFW